MLRRSAAPGSRSGRAGDWRPGLDPHAAAGALTQIGKRYSPHADHGMLTTARFRADLQPATLDWISALKTIHLVRHFWRLLQKLPKPALQRLMEVNIVTAAEVTDGTANPQTARGRANPGLPGASRDIRSAHRQGAVPPLTISGSGLLLR